MPKLWENEWILAIHDRIVFKKYVDVKRKVKCVQNNE